LIITDPEGIRNEDEWGEIKVIGMWSSEREVNGKLSVETHYFIGSREMNAKKYAEVLRGHWGIENSLHWQLDITFGEDRNRVQKRHGGENLALVRKLALLDQPSAVSGFFVAHTVEDSGRGGKILAQSLGKIGKDALIFFFQRNRQCQNFALGKILEVLHGE
jgi:hypothetical protein